MAIYYAKIICKFELHNYLKLRQHNPPNANIEPWVSYALTDAGLERLHILDKKAYLTTITMTKFYRVLGCMEPPNKETLK